MSRAFPTQGIYAGSIFILYQNVLTQCQALNVPILPAFKAITTGSNEYAQDAPPTIRYINQQADILTQAYAASIGAPPPY